MLEDDFTYVLRKALVGHQLHPAQVAIRAGIPEDSVQSFLTGDFSAETARKLARVLHLNPDAYAAHQDYIPRPIVLPQIRQLNLPFGNEQVNSWYVKVGDEAILFDTGYTSSDLSMALETIGLPLPERAFITHSHRDHIGAVNHLQLSRVPMHAMNIESTIQMISGDTVVWKTLSIRALDLSGHCTPALGFVVDGLEAPVLVTGDALFAGSIGGCGSPGLYQTALKNLRQAVALLPDTTVLLPGHGPPTTLGEERHSNPFL